MVAQIQEVLGGRIEERWGEIVLHVSGAMANGSIRFLSFEWGVSMVDLDITFYRDVAMITDASTFNPIRFLYGLKGHCLHRFEYQPESELRKLEPFHSTIFTSKNGGWNHLVFPKEVPLQLNIIHLTRKHYLKKRLNGVEKLNSQLYEVFHDLDHENTFAGYGAYDLRLADKIGALRKIRASGMIRIMQIEGLVYQVLSKHIADHERLLTKKRLPSNLRRKELQQVRKLAKRIISEPSEKYRLEELAAESGLSQAKLQEGFKLLYTRTVTEYVRHVRLEAARDYLRETDMNISQVVYTVGFSSRSYFSKIFKEKYRISPSEYKESVLAQRSISI